MKPQLGCALITLPDKTAGGEGRGGTERRRDGGTEERRREKGLHEDNNDKDKPMRPLTGHLYLSPTPLLHMYGHLPMELLRASWPISWAVACESMR